ncbi:MAG: dihydroneopterin aldolase [Pseudomonadota bacterium]
MNLPSLAPGYYAVFLENFRRNIRLGVTPEEIEAQLVQMDIIAIVQRIGPGDTIEDVVDYNHLRDTAIEVGDAQHYGLQETLCEVMIEKLMAHEVVSGVIIQTRKVTLFDDAGSVGCHQAQIDPAALAP